MLLFLLMMMWQTEESADTTPQEPASQETAAEETAAEPDLNAFRDTEATWRSEREESFRAETSWLNLVGLYWLQDGPNPFGSDPRLRFSLPPHSTVAKTGTFYLEDGRVRYEMNRGQRATVNGKTANNGTLELEQVLSHNHLRLLVIERSGKLAIRARDLRLKKFRKFEGLNFYRAKPDYVINADFIPYEEPKTMKVTTVISTEVDYFVPGEIRFEMHGKTMTMLPTLLNMDDEEYLIMFQDKTSGVSTYSGGRYLYAPKPVDGKIQLNFNRAYNPPCAYTVYATCPLPPSGNWLEVPIEAGERIYLKPGEY